MLSVFANRPEALIFVLDASVTTAQITAVTEPVGGTPVDTFDADDDPVVWPQSLTASIGLTTVWFSPALQWHDAGDYVISLLLDGSIVSEVQLEVRAQGSPPGPAPGDGFYCSIGDVRAEGLTEAAADDDRVAFLIWMISREFDERTGRRFGAEAKTIRLDGTGGRAQLLREPIVSVTRVGMVDSAGDVTDLEDDDFRVYNRHLTQGLLDPDDRDSPKIEFVHGREPYGPVSGGIFDEGVQNVEIEGKFGFTDPDGTTDGRIPDLIRRACTLLVIDRGPIATDPDADAARTRARLIKEKTRDQEYQLQPQATSVLKTLATGTGNAQVDQILAMFTAPPVIRCA